MYPEDAFTARWLMIIFSPAGLNATTDEELNALLSDLESWKANLPEDLKFRGPETPRNAGTSLVICILSLFTDENLQAFSLYFIRPLT